MREYALQVEQEKKSALRTKPISHPGNKQLSQDNSARKRALKFARTIRKPRPSPQTIQTAKTSESNQGNLKCTSESLENLEHTHNEQQKKVEAIRRQLERMGT